MRLANGKIVRTVGCCKVTVIFGNFHFVGNFHVLDCAVPLILGMDFLSKVQPLVDFKAKTVTI